jgi:hypothetical protein
MDFLSSTRGLSKIWLHVREKKVEFLNLGSKYGDFNFFFFFNSKKIPLYKWHLPKCGGGHTFSTMATIFWIFWENLKIIIEKKKF